MDHSWSVVGLDEDESRVEIDSKEYCLEKRDAAIVHSILCLTDAMSHVADEVAELRLFLESK
jgi:hypothetical protein